MSCTGFVFDSKEHIFNSVLPSGCGAYCDNAVGGISTTGPGEAIMRSALAARVLFYMEQGKYSGTSL